MKTCSIAAICACLAAVGLCGCKQEIEKTVSLSGQIAYDGYQSGVIVIKVCESETSAYTSGNDVFSKTPGDCPKTVVVDEPGPFVANQTFSWVEGHKPDIELLAYVVPTAQTDVQDCEAGDAVTLPLASDDDVLLTLVAGECPARE